jgi:hypothetical protein
LIDSEPETHKWLSGFLLFFHSSLFFFSWLSGFTEDRESFSSINYRPKLFAHPGKVKGFGFSELPDPNTASRSVTFFVPAKLTFAH